MDFSDKQSRKDALKALIVLPALAGAMALGTSVAAEADQKGTNQAQFKYQDKPGKNGEKCSQCRFFKPPNGCQIVTGKISRDGWCISWAKKS
jgi:hypothetical protein